MAVQCIGLQLLQLTTFLSHGEVIKAHGQGLRRPSSDIAAPCPVLKLNYLAFNYKWDNYSQYGHFQNSTYRSLQPFFSLCKASPIPEIRRPRCCRIFPSVFFCQNSHRYAQARSQCPLTTATKLLAIGGSDALPLDIILFLSYCLHVRLDSYAAKHTWMNRQLTFHSRANIGGRRRNRRTSSR